MGRLRKPGSGTFEVYQALLARRDHAVSLDELRVLAGVEERAFLNALAWMDRTGEITRWRRDNRGDGYAVLTEFAMTAWYDHPVELPAICSFFGQPERVTVRRSIPFVLSSDEDASTQYRNRYRQLDAVA